jgi:hypothetical protein
VDTRSPDDDRVSGYPPPADDLPSALERLADLHDRGQLTDDEYAAAKRRMIEGT